MTTTYKGLFEDEVAAILRSLPFTGSVRIGFYSFYPAGMICEDGIYTSGNGYFSEYLNGQRTGSHRSLESLIRELTGEEFTITTY